MPRTVVCFKWVPVDSELRVDPATGVLDVAGARRSISTYDRNAIEAARRTASVLEGELVGFTAGDAHAKAGLKEALARGVDRAIHLSVGDEVMDGHVTARVLAAGIRGLDDVGLIVCGEGAADTYAHEVGPRLASRLGLPVVTNVREMTVQDGVLHAARVVGGEIETVECDLPAVVTVVAEIGPAPIPGLKAVIAAGRRPAEVVDVSTLGLSPDDLRPRAVVEDLAGFRAEREHVVIDSGSAQERADILLAALRTKGVL